MLQNCEVPMNIFDSDYEWRATLEKARQNRRDGAALSDQSSLNCSISAPALDCPTASGSTCEEQAARPGGSRQDSPGTGVEDGNTDVVEWACLDPCALRHVVRRGRAIVAQWSGAPREPPVARTAPIRGLLRATESQKRRRPTLSPPKNDDAAGADESEGATAGDSQAPPTESPAPCSLTRSLATASTAEASGGSEADPASWAYSEPLHSIGIARKEPAGQKIARTRR